MKSITLIIATALTTGTILGLSIDSATAVGFGGGSSYSKRSNVPDLSYSLVFNTNDANPDDNIGEYLGAVTNFRYFDDCFSNQCDRAPLSNLAIFLGQDIDDFSFDFSGGNLIAELDSTSNLVKYTISSPNNFDVLLNDDTPFSREFSSGDIYTFEVDVNGLSLAEQQQYVDLSFILDNNIPTLATAEEITVNTSGFPSINLDLPNDVENEFDCSEDLINGYCVDTFTVDIDPPPSDIAIPEPSSLLSLWILGTLGTLTSIMRKTK